MPYHITYKLEVNGLKSIEETEFFEFLLEKEFPHEFENVTRGVGGIGVGHNLQFSNVDYNIGDYTDAFKKLAQRFPHATIDLEGEGEEAGDIWKHRFKGDQNQYVEAEFQIPDFDI